MVPIAEVFNFDLIDRLYSDTGSYATTDTDARTPTNRTSEENNPTVEEKPSAKTRVQFNLKKAPSNASEPRRASFQHNVFEGEPLFGEQTNIACSPVEGGTMLVANRFTYQTPQALAYCLFRYVYGPNSELPLLDDVVRLLVSPNSWISGNV